MNEPTDGQTLKKAWPSLSEPQETAVADQVVQVRKQPRFVPSASIQCVNHSPCYPGLIVFDLEPRGPFHADQELWDALSLHLHHIPQKVLDNLKKRLPKHEPYVLTLCELNVGNIMIQDANFVGILNWEYAALFLSGMNMPLSLLDSQI
jgi:hypothetical protein